MTVNSCQELSQIEVWHHSSATFSIAFSSPRRNREGF